MSSVSIKAVKTIRSFNRFYTSTLGLLDQHILDSEFSLAEVRILHDVAYMDNCTAKKLIESLHIDPGYLSRILKHFEKSGYIYRVQSKEDKRLYHLYLTDLGKQCFGKLDELASKQIRQMISNLSEEEQTSISNNMQAIEDVLSKEPIKKCEDISIRHELRPGDAGKLIALHGWIYAEECGWYNIFEGYVCKTLYEFLLSYSPDKDRIWFVESAGEMVGAIAIVGHTAARAQLRWFILHPDYRALGLGKRLLEDALAFCREKGYKQVFLDTTDEQKKAIAMYKKAGFVKVAEHENKLWGKPILEETYELEL